jgi:hypothetical protein
MASYNYTFTSGDTVTPTKLNSARTVSEIVNADVSATAAISGTKVAPAFGAQDITVSTANRSITNTGNFALSFGTNNTNRLTIPAAGGISIATGSPDRIGAAFSNNAVSTLDFGSPNSGAGNFQLQYDRNGGTFRFFGGTTGSQTERMRIDAFGNVGIGTTSPSQSLHVIGNVLATSSPWGTSASAHLYLGDTLNGLSSTFGGATTLTSFGATTFVTGSTPAERMRIAASGNVGINDTAPAYHLDVNGDANVTGVWRVDDTQVVTNRRTGWAAPTGTATRTTFATSTVTTAQLAERVKALIDDLTTHGLIGA